MSTIYTHVPNTHCSFPCHVNCKTHKLSVPYVTFSSSWSNFNCCSTPISKRHSHWLVYPLWQPNTRYMHDRYTNGTGSHRVALILFSSRIMNKLSFILGMRICVRARATKTTRLKWPQHTVAEKGRAAAARGRVWPRLGRARPRGISLCTDLLMRNKLRVYPAFRF